MHFTENFNQFHFIRPAWLWAIVVLIVLLWIQSRNIRSSRSWQAVCDPQLLPYILSSMPGSKKRWPLFIIAFTGVLIILALAGPAWKQLEQPVFREQSALVIVMDLSRSMDAADIKPSRVARARLKIIDILKQRNEGQTALIVYAADAFVVSPLTDDAETIIAQVPSLSTSLMPSQGSRPDLALEKAMHLLQQAGVPRGDMLLVTDSADNSMLKDTVKKLTGKGHRLSVLGVGTVEGAPIAIEGGGFLKDRDGSIVIPKLDEQALHSLALQGGGRYRTLATDESDIDSLLANLESGCLDAAEKQAGFKADIWREEGPWLLLLVIPIAALAFRRGYLLLFVFLCLPLPVPANALTWTDLWSRPDQQASQALERGEADKAARLFEDPQWQAAAHYRARDYQQSIKALEGINTPDALYNKGNALAQLGRYPEAIAAYEEALKLDPQHEDARYNRDLIKKQMEQQSKNQSQSQSQDQSRDQSQSQSEQQSQQQQSQNSESKSGQQDNQTQAQNSQSQQNQPGTQQDQNQQQGNEHNQASPADQQDSQQQQSMQASRDRQQDDDGVRNESADSEESKADGAKENSVSAMRENENQQDGEQVTQAQAMADMTEHSEVEQANEQWLRRIPDDPGGLLRRKFQYQSQQNSRQQNQEEQPW